MDTQLQQLRDAVKAVAKARAEGRPIDLSALPPEIRQKIQAQLDKLPPETRQQLHSGVARAGQSVKGTANRAATSMRDAVVPTYHGHFNSTIRPGDASRVPVMWIAAVVLGAWALWKYSA